MSVATTIYTNLDVVMLGLMSNDREVGYYDATLSIKSILIVIVSSLGAVLLPRVSYYIEKGMTEQFLRISKRAFNCVALMAVPLVCFFLLFARSTILLFSGSDFSEAILPMRILVPTILCIGLTNISGIQMLVPLGKEKVVLYSEIGGAIVDLVKNDVDIAGYLCIDTEELLQEWNDIDEVNKIVKILAFYADSLYIYMSSFSATFSLPKKC